MFKFNFNQDPDPGEKKTEELPENLEKGDESRCVEHESVSENFECEKGLQVIEEVLGLKHIDCADVIGNMDSKPEYLNGNSDLVKNVYEGGMKIWECSIDLVKYLSETVADLHGKKVLELGCGAALPGLFCLKNGLISDLHLQDFNPEVIEHITKPNVALNQCSNSKIPRAETRFFSGDWSDFLAKMSKASMKYDLILTSETIYEEVNYYKLLSIFDQLLEPNGLILLAAKIHYFGVGGGLRSFEKTLPESKWTFRTVFENSDSVKREVIEIKRRIS